MSRFCSVRDRTLTDANEDMMLAARAIGLGRCPTDLRKLAWKRPRIDWGFDGIGIHSCEI